MYLSDWKTNRFNMIEKMYSSSEWFYHTAEQMHWELLPEGPWRVWYPTERQSNKSASEMYLFYFFLKLRESAVFYTRLSM